MGLSRKFLAALGIEADKVDEIIIAHTETVDGLKEQLSQYKAAAEKLPIVEKELNDFKSKSTSENSYKERYEKEHKAFEDFKTATAKEKTLAAKTAAYKDVLKDAGITSEKAIAKVLKYSNLDDYELDDDGKFKDAAAVLKAVKEEWPEQITTTGTQGEQTAHPPASTGGSKMTLAQIDAIEDTAERQAAMLENAELFGI